MCVCVESQIKRRKIDDYDVFCREIVVTSVCVCVWTDAELL